MSSWAECQATAAALALGRRVIRSASVLRKVMTGICLIGVWNYAECTGIADLFADPIFHIVSESKLTSEEMASLLLGSQCMAKDRFRRSRLYWEIPLPVRGGTHHPHLKGKPS